MMSARLGMPGNCENVVKLEADHSTVCKFGSSEDDRDNLKLVKANIKDLYREALKKSEYLATPSTIGEPQGFDEASGDNDKRLQERMRALRRPD
jgi:hypothetical protein